MNSIYYPLQRFTTVDDVALDALVMDESSSLRWFSFRAKVGTNFDPGANHSSGEHVHSCCITVSLLNLFFMKRVCSQS